MSFRAGTGYDLHPLAEGRPFCLGGVRLEWPRGPDGHSDGDVLCHALCDAILGAAAAGDIGSHFPPGDARWKDAPGLDLLARAAEIARARGFEVVNVDATVLLEAPRIGPHIGEMVRGIAGALRIPESAVSVKAKTNEGFGEVGQGDAVAAHAVALLEAAG